MPEQTKSATISSCVKPCQATNREEPQKCGLSFLATEWCRPLEHVMSTHRAAPCLTSMLCLSRTEILQPVCGTIQYSKESPEPTSCTKQLVWQDVSEACRMCHEQQCAYPCTSISLTSHANHTPRSLKRTRAHVRDCWWKKKTPEKSMLDHPTITKQQLNTVTCIPSAPESLGSLENVRGLFDVIILTPRASVAFLLVTQTLEIFKHAGL